MTKDPLFRFVIFFLFMVLMCILLLGCRTKRECTKDMVVHTDSMEASVATAERRVFLSLFDSLTLNSQFAADSIVIHIEGIRQASSTEVSAPSLSGRAGGGAIAIYGASVKSQATRQTTAQQGRVEMDSMTRFRHWCDSAAVHSKEVRHPPKNGSHRIMGLLLLSAFIVCLLCWAKR